MPAVPAFIKLTVLRVVLPFLFFAACLIRPSILSLFYGILGFLALLVPTSSYGGPGVGARYYVLISLILCIFCFVAQLATQIYLVSEPKAKERIGDCGNSSELILRTFGLQELSKNAPGQSARILLPEILALFSSLIGLVVIFVMDTSSSNADSTPSKTSRMPLVSDSLKRERILHSVGLASELLVVFLCGLVGTLQPSLLSVIYYLSFISILVWWGIHKPLITTVLNVTKLLLALFAMGHFCLIYAYQITAFQNYLDKDGLTARLLGLVPLFSSECPEPWNLHIVSGAEWWQFSEPFVLLGFFIILVFQMRCVGGCDRPRSPKLLDASGDGDSSVHEEGLKGEGDVNARPLVLLTGGAGSSQGNYPPPSRLFSVGTTLFSHDEGGVYGFVARITNSILQHSYALALVAMMAWALLYHTWLTFVWLILACIIWIYPNSQKLYYSIAPIIVIYAVLLLLKQYIFSLNLTDSEMPTSEDIILKQIGFKLQKENPWKDLWVKTLLALPFFITLRLSTRERRQRHDPTYGTFQGMPRHESGLSLLEGNAYIGRILCKYWIYVVALVLLLISIRHNVYVYSIGYMLFFIVLVSALVVSFRCLRGILFMYLTLLLIYSSVILVTIYLYQFDRVDSWWQNVTHLDPIATADLGLKFYKDPGGLLNKLLSPISFMVVCAMQLKFFNKGFLKLTGLEGNRAGTNAHEGNRAGTTAQEGVQIEEDNYVDEGESSPKKWYLRYFKQAHGAFNAAVELSWKLAELHVRKLVPFAILMLAVYEVCVLNVPLVVLVVVMVFLPFLYTITCLLSCVWIGLVIIVKMVFQLRTISVKVNESGLLGNQSCIGQMSSCDVAVLPENETWIPVSYSDWAGVAGVARIGPQLAVFIVALVILAFQSVVNARQWWVRKVNGTGEPARNVLFPNVTRDHADQGIMKCIQYLANYGFYKFGVEISFAMTTVVVLVRMDAYAFLYAICLLGLFCMSRNTQSYVWYAYTLLLAMLLPIQYAFVVGLPPQQCIEYPWNVLSDDCSQQRNLVTWLYLPAYVNSPNPLFLIADFFQLLFVCYQLFVFRIERAEGGSFEGGDNSQIYLKPMASGQLASTNPVYDYITHKRCSLDYLKAGLFQYFQWVTLVMVFVAGLGGISLFALGYLIAAFIFLWKGNDLYLKPMQSVITKWRAITYYTIIIVILKVALQVIGCVYVEWLNENACWLNQLFSIACLKGRILGETEEKDVSCEVEVQEAAVTYDVICFIFLIIQLRILGSNYFKHVVVEFRAQKVLSSRGAVLINQLTDKELREQEAVENKIFDSIRKRMQAIKIRYEKQVEEGQGGPEATNYAQEAGSGSSRIQKTAKRAGDYFMFDYDADEDDALVVESQDKPDFDPEAEQATGMDPFQLIHAAINKDMDFKGINEEADRMKRVSEGEQDDVTPPFVEEEEVGEEKKKKLDDSEDDDDDDKAPAAPGFVKRFLISVLDYLSVKFNRMSRDYRYVEFVLKKEKKALKESYYETLADLNKSTHELRKEWIEGEMGRSLRVVQNESDLEKLESEVSKVKENILLRFFIAVFNLLAANTDLLCFMFMAANHVTNASLLSLPLPLMAFLWGTLCNPRPPKFFWIVVISYTEAVVIAKFLFQFGFFPWNAAISDNPLWAPRILGIEKRDYFAAWDVALLIVLFFHRYMLRRLGLWKDAKHQVCTIEIDGIDGVSHANSNSAIQEITKESEEPIEEQDTVELEGSRYGGGCAQFWSHLLKPAFRYIRDLYPWMFLCDFVCVLLIVFGFKAFYISGTGDVLADIQSSRVPLPFVLMLLLMVLLIVIDRAIYLRKSVFAKLIFQIILVLGLHAWIFFALPSMTGKSTMENRVAQVWYMIKCIYLLFSAWQIRNGYPSRILGNLLTRSYSIISYSLFTGFMVIPFLFEIRTIIDWVWTETSMPIFDFFNMENYFAKIYQLKCMRKLETDFPAPRGQPKGNVVKWAMGIPMLIIIIGCVFLPLLLFSMLNYIGFQLIPDSVKFSITIQGYPPLYTMTSQGWWIESIEPRRGELTGLFARDRGSLAFLNDYSDDASVKAVLFQNASMIAWDISPPARRQLIIALNESTETLGLEFKWEFARPREKITEDPKVKIEKAFPPYVIIPESGAVTPASSLLQYAYKQFFQNGKYDKPSSDLKETWAPLEISLKATNGSFPDGPAQEYWNIAMDTNTKPYKEYILPLAKGYVQTGVQMVAFIDRVFPSAFKSFTGGGIIGVYVALVLVIGKMVRGLITKDPLDVIVSEMPYVDRLLKICLDLYLVREAKDFFLEQDLYSRIIFLFRSPETLIKWTKPPKIKNE